MPQQPTPPGPAWSMDAGTEQLWRDFFARGELLVIPVDRERLRRRLRHNAVVLGGCSGVAALAVAGIVAVLWAGLASPLLLLVLAALPLAAGLLFLRFWLTRRRLQAGEAAQQWLAISRDGLRVGDTLDVPWSAVAGGFGFDGRGARAGRAALRITRAAGAAEAEFVVAVAGVRALRDAAPPAFRGLFEVIGGHGGLRIPLDPLLAPEQVRTAIVAMAVAGRLAGSKTLILGAGDPIARATMAVLGDPARLPAALDAAITSR